VFGRHDVLAVRLRLMLDAWHRVLLGFWLADRPTWFTFGEGFALAPGIGFHGRSG
jgi:hypothetical protein